MLILHGKNLDLKPVFKTLVTTLLLSDSICIILSILIFSVPRLSHQYEFYIFPHLIPVILPLTQISLTISVYTTVAVAVERFISRSCRSGWR